VAESLPWESIATSVSPAIEAFITRWENSGAAERANYQMFLSELCDILEVPRPGPCKPPSKAPIPTLPNQKSTIHNPQSTIVNPSSLLPWPDRLPDQVALIRKLLITDPTATAETLTTLFVRKNKKRTDQIEGILETLKGLGQL
jgi:hypothetical protein